MGWPSIVDSEAAVCVLEGYLDEGGKGFSREAV